MTWSDLTDCIHSLIIELELEYIVEMLERKSFKLMIYNYINKSLNKK